MRQRRGALSAGLGESNEAASQVARRHSGRRSARIHTRKGVKSFVRLVVGGDTAGNHGSAASYSVPRSCLPRDERWKLPAKGFSRKARLRGFSQHGW
jgi:hypothetical protein